MIRLLMFLLTISVIVALWVGFRKLTKWQKRKAHKLVIYHELDVHKVQTLRNLLRQNQKMQIMVEYGYSIRQTKQLIKAWDVWEDHLRTTKEGYWSL